MDNELNDIEEEMEELEEEIEEEEQVRKPKRSTSAKKKVKVPEVEPQPTEKYIAVHQKEVIGIADTLTGELVVDGLKDLPTALIEALKLNKLDKIEIASGA